NRFQILMQEIQQFNDTEESKFFQEYQMLNAQKANKLKFTQCLEQVKKVKKVKLLPEIFSEAEIKEIFNTIKENNLLNKFTEIWSYDNEADYLAKYDVNDDKYKKLIKTLYSFDSNKRKQILL